MVRVSKGTSDRCTVEWFTELELGSQCSSPPRRRLDLPEKASQDDVVLFPLH